MDIPLLPIDERIIMFYNVENLYDIKDDPLKNDDDYTPNGFKQWNTYNLDQKIDNLVRVIEDPDAKLPIILGLAEVENKHVLDLLRKHPKLIKASYQIVHENSMDERGVDVAFLYQKRYFEYKSHEVVRFDFDLPNGKKDYTRDILYVQGSFHTNETVHFFINHWSSRREGVKQSEKKRVIAAQFLNAKIAQILTVNKDAKIIIMGDFNDEPFNKSIFQILGASNRMDDDLPFYNLHYRYYLDRKGTINHHGKWMVFDQIIVSKNLINSDNGIHVHPFAGKILKKKWMLFKHPKGDLRPNKSYSGSKYHQGFSDHLPVYAELNTSS